MIKSSDEKLYKALVSIQSYPEWSTIRQWLDDSLKHNDSLARKEIGEVQSRWYQGSAKELENITKCLDNAKITLDTLQNNR